MECIYSGSSEGADSSSDALLINMDPTESSCGSEYNGLAGEDDVARSLALDSEGNIWVSGWSADENGHDDYITMHYSPRVRDSGLAAIMDPAMEMTVPRLLQWTLG